MYATWNELEGSEYEEDFENEDAIVCFIAI